MARSKRKDDLVSRYARIRKPVPPPETVEKDKRKEFEDRVLEQEIDEALDEGGGQPEDSEE